MIDTSRSLANFIDLLKALPVLFALYTAMQWYFWRFKELCPFCGHATAIHYPSRVETALVCTAKYNTCGCNLIEKPPERPRRSNARKSRAEAL